MPNLYDSVGADIFVAMDLPGIQEVVDAESCLSGVPHGLKCGMELCNAAGTPEVLRCLADKPLFVDEKLTDIPTTIAKTVRVLSSKLQRGIINVYAACGRDSMRAAVENRGGCLIFAVTVLTSMTEADCERIYGVGITKAVMRLATEAWAAGVQGLICAAEHAPLLKANFPSLMLLCPGSRPHWASANEQKQISTPAESVVLGADGIVIGRPVLQPPAPLLPKLALMRVQDEMNLMRLFQQYEGLRSGHFVLKSGLHSDRYLNKDVLFPHAAAIEKVTLMLGRLTTEPHNVSLIVGPETGGAKLAKALSEYLGHPWAPAVKTLDGKGFILSVPVAGKDVFITEDILSTGGSVEKVVKLVESLGGRVIKILGLVNRGGVQLPNLDTVASLRVQTWAPDGCPLCRQGVPINTDLGHGSGRK